MQMKKWQEMTLKEKITGIVVLIFIVLIIFMVIAGLSGGNKKETKSKDTQTKLDASATIACQDFNRVIKDAKSGILTGQELREKVKVVNDNAKLSSDLEVKNSAIHVLQAITTGTTEEFIVAADLLQKSCSK